MTEKAREMSVNTKDLKKGNVIRGEILNAADPTKIEKRLLWIRGDNGSPNIVERVLQVEDQLLRPEEVAVLDILSGKVGPYDVVGVYTPEQIGVVDPRKSIKEEVLEGLEPIVSSKIEPGVMVRTSSITELGEAIDQFTTIIEASRGRVGKRSLDMRDEFGNEYHGVPETSLRSRKLYDGWMRFEGIIPQQEQPK